MLRFSWRVLSVYAFEEMEAADVHGTSVVLSGGDEWKTDRRLSIQPRGLLFRRGEFRGKWSFGARKIVEFSVALSLRKSGLDWREGD